MFTTRRSPVVDLAALTGWAPAATSLSGDDVPLGDVLDRLLDGLAASPTSR